jgi:cytochrome P450
MPGFRRDRAWLFDFLDRRLTAIQAAVAARDVPDDERGDNILTMMVERGETLPHNELLDELFTLVVRARVRAKVRCAHGAQSAGTETTAVTMMCT